MQNLRWAFVVSDYFSKCSLDMRNLYFQEDKVKDYLTLEYCIDILLVIDNRNQ